MKKPSITKEVKMILNYADVDWHKLVKSEKLSEKFIRKYIEYLDMHSIFQYQSKNISEEFIEDYYDKLSTDELYALYKYKEDLSSEFLYNHICDIKISIISLKLIPKLPEEFVIDNLNKICYGDMCKLLEDNNLSEKIKTKILEQVRKEEEEVAEEKILEPLFKKNEVKHDPGKLVINNGNIRNVPNYNERNDYTTDCIIGYALTGMFGSYIKDEIIYIGTHIKNFIYETYLIKLDLITVEVIQTIISDIVTNDIGISEYNEDLIQKIIDIFDYRMISNKIKLITKKEKSEKIMLTSIMKYK